MSTVFIVAKVAMMVGDVRGMIAGAGWAIVRRRRGNDDN